MNLAVKRSIARLLLKTDVGGKVVNSKKLWRHLDEIGWFRSRAEGLPVDRMGKALPWFTYPAICFLETRVSADMCIFEYGSGNSTFWWSARVATLVSCEHDHSWYQAIQPRVPGNVDYIYRDMADIEAYCGAVLAYNKSFHVIAIDGRERARCAKTCLKALRDDGVIVWDDAHRDQYANGLSYLRSQGFRQLDFDGISPLSARLSRTSVFYRERNCLGL